MGKDGDVGFVSLTDGLGMPHSPPPPEHESSGAVSRKLPAAQPV